MRDLFELDMKDYVPDGRVYTRPSVRAVIIQNDRVLLIYSKMYDYYKFPGGGIEPGENHITALCREVKEESGYSIIPETIREFGRVLRRQKDAEDENGIFEQENLYYFCEITSDSGEVHLDRYEKEEGFTAMWVEPFPASRHNRFNAYKCYDVGMVRREEKVLDLVDLQIRRQNHLAHEAATIESLGHLDYKDMLHFVEEQLGNKKTENIGAKIDIAYSRFEHTKRVLGWAKRLYDMADNKEKLNYEDIMIAAIFHDVGRNVSKSYQIPHAQAGVPITREYLLSKGFEAERTEYICSLVGGHSDKNRMQEADVDPNLLLLMEADLLDDTGALGIVMDCMITEARNPEARFMDSLDHIMRYTYREQHENPMVTQAGKQLWNQKIQLVDTFVAALHQDVIL